MNLEFSQKIFEKCSNTKFHENPYSGSQVVPCGQTDRHEEVCRNFANAPKNQIDCRRQWQLQQIGDLHIPLKYETDTTVLTV